MPIEVGSSCKSECNYSYADDMKSEDDQTQRFTNTRLTEPDNLAAV